jgi:predicted methyltransferase
MRKNKVLIPLLLASLMSTHAVADIYDDAVANSARTEKDQSVDERRKPAEVMRFFEIKPNSRVLDVFAGGGYYSELLASVVGTEGEVVLYNNAPWDRFVDKGVSARLKDNRLPNVTRLITTPESLNNQTDTFQSAIFVLGIHDLYYTDPEQGWVAIDKPVFLTNIYKLLDDGGVFGVIDANAEAGADNQAVGKSLHRVDPAVMIKDIEAAGFTLEASSNLLRNPKDDKTTSVFTPENRYNTDRSVLKFRK